MSADFQAVKSIFLNAAAKADRAERAAYLDQACDGDADLRQHVEALLQAHEASGNILDARAGEPAATLPPRPELAGDTGPAASEQVGLIVADKYKLVQKLGEGGMGSVWVAEQSQPLKRRVALKMIRPGLASHLVLRRFEAERQALAMMDNANIAKILEAGETQDGRPFFVMELVKGVPITRYCDELHLSIRERLNLFIPICQAIQHAHQKGIIHRDIKPSNVLVAIQDGVPAPKVIDFGVAKALNQRLTEETMNTQIGAVVGTLEYMSPEQAELSELDIDTRADVYALGVLLYELLTGTTPLNRSQLKDAAIFEMLRMIKQDEPPKPSTRLSESKESLASRAAERRTEPRRLAKEVRGDLDWIVMKCLEKDRTRRYESASALARDVERFLAEEPVEAGPPKASYRLRKFVSRNRAPVAAAAMIVVVLLLGVAVSLWQAIRASHAETKAREEALHAEQARLAESAERQRADEQRIAAEENRAAAARARDEAETALYFNRITLADHYWASNNLNQSRRIIDACPSQMRGWEWHYLDRLNHADLLTLPCNGQYTCSLRFSKDGKRLATLAQMGDSGARIWDLTTNKPLSTVTLSKSHRQFWCGDLSRDGKIIALGDQAGAIGLWEADTGKLIREFARLPECVTSISFSPDGNSLAAACAGDAKGANLLSGASPQLAIWEVPSGKQLFRSLGYGINVEFSPDGSRLLSQKKRPFSLLRARGSDYALALFDTATWKELAADKLGSAESVSFSGDGKKLAICRPGETENTHIVRVIDPITGKELDSLALGSARNIALSFDGATLALYGEYPSNQIEVWDCRTKRQIHVLRGHTDWLQDIVFAPDGRLASCSTDGSIKFWDPFAGQVPRRLASVANSRATSPEAFGQHGALLAYGDLKTVNPFRAIARSVSVVDPSTGRLIRTLPGHEGGTQAVAFSEDGTRVATGGLTGDEKLLARANSRTNDSRKAASDLKGEIKVWNVVSGEFVSTFLGHDGWIGALALNPDGSLAASAQQSKDSIRFSSLGSSERDPSLDFKKMMESPIAVEVWEVQTGRVRWILNGHVGEITQLAFSPDGRLLASFGSSASRVKVWDLTTGSLMREFGVSEFVSLRTDLVFSPHSDLLVLAGRGVAQVWDVATGRSVAVLHEGIGRVAINPDQTRLARSTGSEIKIWDLKSGQEALTLPVPRAEAHRPDVPHYPLAWSSDGHRLRAALADGAVVEWDATPRSGK